MTKWTKGPWVAFSDMPDVATHHDGQGEDDLFIENEHGFPSCKSEHDANLIAAAPELYEALEATTRELQGYIDRENERLKASISSLDLDEPEWHDMQTVCESHMVMAKARGEL